MTNQPLPSSLCPLEKHVPIAVKLHCSSFFDQPNDNCSPDNIFPWQLNYHCSLKMPGWIVMCYILANSYKNMTSFALLLQQRLHHNHFQTKIIICLYRMRFRVFISCQVAGRSFAQIVDVALNCTHVWSSSSYYCQRKSIRAMVVCFLISKKIQIYSCPQLVGPPNGGGTTFQTIDNLVRTSCY